MNISDFEYFSPISIEEFNLLRITKNNKLSNEECSTIQIDDINNRKYYSSFKRSIIKEIFIFGEKTICLKTKTTRLEIPSHEERRIDKYSKISEWWVICDNYKNLHN